MSLPIRFVDVFGTESFSGNSLAVVAEADAVTTDAMQAIARWFNLPETTFLCRPTAEADYAVRIFTPDRELPFAGHPTLGSCHAWLTAGGAPHNPNRIVQQCTAGLVTIRSDEGRLAFAAPPLLRSGPLDDAMKAEVAQVLGIEMSEFVDCAWVDNGPGWCGVLLAPADAVLSLEPLRGHKRSIEIGVIGPHAAGSQADFEVRAFLYDRSGALVEDPVTGSLNASLGQWLFASGRAVGPYVVAQGSRVGRTGTVFVNRDSDGTVWIGGETRTLISGAVEV